MFTKKDGPAMVVYFFRGTVRCVNILNYCLLSIFEIQFILTIDRWYVSFFIITSLLCNRYSRNTGKCKQNFIDLSGAPVNPAVVPICVLRHRPSLWWWEFSSSTVKSSRKSANYVTKIHLVQWVRCVNGNDLPNEYNSILIRSVTQRMNLTGHYIAL